MADEFPSVLFVDSDLEAPVDYIKGIQYKGLAVTQTKEPYEAITFTLNHDLKIIMANVNLPELSGLELCVKLKKKLKKKRPIILFDTKDSLDSLESGLNSGADDFFIKDGHPEIAIESLGFWMYGEFLGLPPISMKNALELTYFDFLAENPSFQDGVGGRISEFS